MKRFFLWLSVFGTAMFALPAQSESFSEIPQNQCGQALALPTRAEMEVALQSYLQLSEEALSMRAMAIQLYYELEARKKHGPLSGQDLQRINAGIVALLEQRAKLFKTALAYECWAATPPDVRPEEGDIQRTGVLISLSAALTLYDNYLSAVTLYRDDPELRRHINKPDRGFALDAGELQKADRIYDSPDIRRRVRQAIKWYLSYGKAPSGFEGYGYLFQSIAQSPSFNLVRKRRPLYVLGRVFEVFGDYTADSLVNMRDESSYFSSLLFGNTVGLVETRRGKLYNKPQAEQHVLGELRAGDILLEKTPFRLTDSFIPGHWGHAAIWVGTEAELRELGIWEHQAVLPHHDAIRAGRGVAEALRSGVELNTLPHFMNIDDLAVLRRASTSPETRAAAILQTLRQIGKEYDFNFNAETTDRMFCSKLVYLAYGDIDWPTSRMLGRFTVSPDDIAQRSINGGPLTIVLLYHDGKSVKNLQPAMEKFLDKTQHKQSSFQISLGQANPEIPLKRAAWMCKWCAEQATSCSVSETSIIPPHGKDALPPQGSSAARPRNARLRDQVGDFAIAFGACPFFGVYSPVVAAVEVNGRLQQPVHDVDMPIAGGKHEGVRKIGRQGVDIRAGGKQALDGGKLAFKRGVMQRRPGGFFANGGVGFGSFGK